MRTSIRLARPIMAMLLTLGLVAGCSAAASDQAGPREWRDMDLVVPVGWLVLDERADLLFVANEDIRADEEELEAGPDVPDDPDANDVVAVQLTTDGSSSADDWRSLVRQEGGVLELDEQIEVGGLPATSLVFRWTTNNVDTRERVIIVPSRQLVILLQPVPVIGQSTAPQVYDRHVDEFEALLASIVWGRPEGA